MEGLDVVVGVGVAGHQIGVGQLDQCVLRAVSHHLFGGGHAYQASVLGQAGQQVEVALFAAGDVARVDARDVGVEVVGDVFEKLLGPFGAVVDDLCVPSLSLDGVDDGEGVFAVAVELLVVAAFDFKYDDSFVHVVLLGYCSMYVQARGLLRAVPWSGTARCGLVPTSKAIPSAVVLHARNPLWCARTQLGRAVSLTLR